MRLFFIAISLFSLSLLSGCSFLSPKPAFQIDQSTLEQLHSWSIEGKLGIKSEQQRQSVNLKWEQQGEDFSLLLFGPFGKGKTQIERKGKRVYLSSGNEYREAKSAEALLYQMSGLHMPIQNLSYWVRGLAKPKTRIQKVRYDDAQRVRQFVQSKWLIEYLRYEPIDGVNLPNKIRLSHKHYTLTIIIKRWSLNAQDQSQP